MPNLNPPRSTTIQSARNTFLFVQYVQDEGCFALRKGKAIPVESCSGPEVFKRLRQQSSLEGGKVVSTTHRLPLSPGNIPGTHFCEGLSGPQGHSAAGRIMSILHYVPTTGK